MIPILYMTYNRIEYTKKTLPILIKNSIGGKIHIVDNGSNDGTQKYLKTFENHPMVEKIIFNDINRGLSPVMNDFFRSVRDFKWAAKVDNDTVVPYNWLNDMVLAGEEAEFDILQASHYFGTTLGVIFEENRKRIKTSNGTVILFRHTGGSGIVVRADKIKRKIPDYEKIYGWGRFQCENRHLRRGFFDGVYVDVLDKEFYNQHRKDIDEEYYKQTGRALQGER